MFCPFCNHPDTKVIDSRLAAAGQQVRRRRECEACAERFNTFESAELVMPQVIKSDQTREPYQHSKLRAGMARALQKRPISEEAIEASLMRIEQSLRNLGEREVPSRHIGELVMNELRQLDEVAYVRFASIYRSFEGVGDFRAELNRLAKPLKTADRSTEPSATTQAGRVEPKAVDSGSSQNKKMDWTVGSKTPNSVDQLSFLEQPAHAKSEKPRS
jgi:transcriptional repressor NrdR